MQDQIQTQDLNERLSLIESMIAEGRRSTESWGWVFLLWGVAYSVAIGWGSWGQGLSVWGNRYAEIGSVRIGLAWPVTMILAVIATLTIGLRKGKASAATSLARSVVSVWVASGIAMLVLFPAFGASGRLDQHSFVAIVAAMLGVANVASGFILRWKAACFGSVAQVTTVFLTAIFFCQIVFGIYAMVLESRRNRREIVHA
jgi:hypothetical protein